MKYEKQNDSTYLSSPFTLGAPIGVSTDGSSIYSDEEESDFDNDSIRQLEWDCLERNLSNVLNGGGDDRSSTTGSKLDRDEAFYL